MSKKIITINVVDVIRILRRDVRKLCIYSGVAGVIGVLIAFTIPKKYQSTVILAPEESGAGFSGSISSLASMVGMNMKIGQTGDALYPEIYPDLVNSTDFIVGLFDVKVRKNKTGETYTYYEYLDKHQKIGLFEYPMVMFGEFLQKFKEPEKQRGVGEKVTPFRLTRKEYNIQKAISGILKCSVDKKTNVITITISDQDPLIAATLADSVKQHLQTTITDYRTKKARVDLQYMQQIYDEAKMQYDVACRQYASSVDANMDAVFMSYKMKQQKMEDDMQLKQNIYTTAAEQLQLAKAKVQERTPAFTVVQSATVPIKHSNQPKIVTLIIWMIFGFIVRFFMLIWKNKDVFISI